MEIEAFPEPLDTEEDEGDTVIGPDAAIQALLGGAKGINLANVVLQDDDMLSIADALKKRGGHGVTVHVENVTVPAGSAADALLNAIRLYVVESVDLTSCRFPPLFIGRMLRREWAGFGHIASPWGLRIIDCGLTANDMQEAMLDRAHLNYLAEVNLSYNPLGDAGVALFLDAYMRNKYHSGQLQTMDLSGTSITSAITPLFARLFSSNPIMFRGLRELALNENPALFVPTDKIRRPVMTMFGPFMEHRGKNPLLHLELGYTGLDDEGVHWLARMLDMAHLIFLGISSNKAITNSGAWYLWEAITKDGVYTRIAMRGTSVSKAVIDDIDTAHTQIMGMYANLRVSPTVPVGSGEYQYLMGLIEYIKAQHALRKLDMDTFLCHVSPQPTIDVDHALFFATSCDYGLFLQYSRWTLDDYARLTWSGKPFASEPIFASKIDHTKVNNWDPWISRVSIDGLPPRRAPQFVNTVTASLASARHTPVFVNEPLIENIVENPYVTLKYHSSEEALIYSLEKINGIDGYVSVDYIPGAHFELPDGSDASADVHVTEVVVLRPSQLLADLYVKQVPKEELEQMGRELAPQIAAEALRQYSENTGGLFMEGPMEESEEDKVIGTSVQHYRLPRTMKYGAMVHKGGFF